MHHIHGCRDIDALECLDSDGIGIATDRIFAKRTYIILPQIRPEMPQFFQSSRIKKAKLL